MSSDRFSAFRHTSYARYFSARFISSLGIQILSVAVGWQIYDQTQNAALLGLIGLVQFLPVLILVIPTGLASDRLGRRFVMALSLAIKMASAFGILYLAVTDQFDALPVLTLLTLFGVARAFYMPASASLVVNLVPTEDFANAVGWNSSTWQVGSIVGPAIGGLLYGLSATIAYTTATLTFAVAAVIMLTIPKPDQLISKEGTSLKMLVGGFRYVWKQKIVLGAISLDLFAMFLGGAVALLPIYARDILELGPAGLGLLRAAPGIGAIIMIGWLTVFPIRDHAGWILFISVGLFGVMTVIFGASTLAWLSILALIGVGAFDMISVYIREILLQLWTPDKVRGRVNAVNAIFLGASNELGEFRAGFMAAAYGAVLTVTGGGIAAMGVAALWAKMFPGLRQARYLEAPDDLDD